VARNEALARAAKHQLDDFDRRVRLEVTARLLDIDAAAAAVRVAERSVGSAA
jgi:hypothetical protein